MQILVADIGGTKSRFALAGEDGRPERIVTIADDDFDGLDDAIGYALGRLAVRPRCAVFAVAGPVLGDEIALTNRPWTFRLSDLRARFGFEHIHAINDFEAMGWALPSLGTAELSAIGPLPMTSEGAKVVLGPGTGLGVAALVPFHDAWHVIASEGGHVSFGPVSADEDDAFARLREAGPVSAERILSGRGLQDLHRALHPGIPERHSEDIIAAAKAGVKEARETIALFVRVLGRFAGDLALTFRATGGVYLAGGVACGLGALLDAAAFRASFETHPPHQALLRKIPTALVTCDEPGLVGCAAFARRIMRNA